MLSLSLSLSLSALTVGTVCAQPGTPCTLGSWLPPFDHGGTSPQTPACANPSVGFPMPFHAAHMSLVPKGAHQGHLLVWDHEHNLYSGNGVGQTRVVRYALIDPVTRTFWNHMFCLAADQGDLFCSGHTWNAEGNLVIAGGTKQHASSQTGAGFLYVWTPPTTLGGSGSWDYARDAFQQQQYLQTDRWYPSVTMLGPDAGDDRDRLLILGGTSGGQDLNHYECWERIGAVGGRMQSAFGVRQWPGPQLPGFGLGGYPRAHFLSTFEVVTAGFPAGTDRVYHDVNGSGGWDADALWLMASPRVYGSNVLYPISPGGAIKDYVVAIGGRNGNSILSTVQTCNAGLSGAGKYWTPVAPASGSIPSLNFPRWLHNTVLLPDSSILVLGGEQVHTSTGCSLQPALVPERYVAGQPAWEALAPDTIVRDYHSTAVLLPSGEVMSAGGESRRRGPCTDCVNRTGCTPPGTPADYRVFQPPYITCGGVRPTIRNKPGQGGAWVWNYGTVQSVSYDYLPFGVTVQKVVLLRPGSVTHHSDGNQRCVELQFLVLPDTDPPSGFRSLQLWVPGKQDNLLPRGYYMLYLVTNQGVPSTAAWVRIS